MNQILDQFLNFQVMGAAFPTLMAGLLTTAEICVVVILLGLAGGLGVALGSLHSSRWVRWPSIVLVDFFRAIPPLVLLIFVYSGLPFAGIRLSPFAAVVIAFLLNNSAYYGEVYRAGILSIGKGQFEAARSTGLTRAQTMLYVVLPQAVRNVLPDLLSNTVEVVKLTSLASVVSLGELLYAADMARSVTYNASPVVMAAAVYLVILWPLVRLVSRFERRLSL
ncbi:amino acid ABC transporter permease [Consotaella salsifontis]|uniref:Amino acid ABC transporter membrane protein 2, PAAT family n=1 Tax=Consotaella salsifontis TaxID=1365950 RepID=A0A1T4SFW8_9HYPH|nr:amino acid ABC transporter permease [Consotaella salsifontis]SKA27112.1 amino acid ABC transporter membrane protein 2, PAAT family [Consotaella salsifontis]